MKHLYKILFEHGGRLLLVIDVSDEEYEQCKRLGYVGTDLKGREWVWMAD
ncbi:MAG: hypothetical protein JWN76_1250 [Chitinophagaceae bacterium]|nr:hypothetical protein [Chitinophagaceae bacterium]